MRLKGLEPPRLSALDPKSSVATNYTTAAETDYKGNTFILFGNIFLQKVHKTLCSNIKVLVGISHTSVGPKY